MNKLFNLTRPQLSLNPTDVHAILVTTAWVCLATHIGFAGYFLWLGVPQMALFNAFSIAFYAYWAAVLPDRPEHDELMAWSSAGEMVLHAMAAVAFIGWASGFDLYIIGAIALITVERSANKSKSALFTAIVVVAYSLADFYAPSWPALVFIEPEILAMTHALNAAALIIIVSYLARTFSTIIATTDEQILEMATLDPLTGLANRRQLLRQTEAQLQTPASEPRQHCLLMVDIDHFKSVNDQHGHNAGDQVLQHVAGIIEHHVRRNDIAGRWGGEEFIVVLPDADVSVAMAIAERLRRAVEAAPYPFKYRALPITITVGVTTIESSERLIDTIDRADHALYCGKDAGRNRTVLKAAA